MPVFTGGGGYAPPTAREVVGGGSVLIANNASAPLTWDTSFGPSALLNRATPTLPTVLAAGVYAVSVWVEGLVLTANGQYAVLLELDPVNDGNMQLTQTSAPSGVVASPDVTVSGTYYLPAGGQIKVTVTNRDGAASRNFNITAAVVQRIS